MTSATRIYRTTVKMHVSTQSPGNPLPQYRWMCNNGEGTAAGFCDNDLVTPRAANFDASIPDDIWDNSWANLNNYILPYDSQDVYDRSLTPTEVPVLVMENAALRATITPQWGGKLWGLYDKVAGRPLLFDNGAFQPGNDAIRKAYTSGGCEWNWGSQIGHAVQTAEDVFVAQLNTTRGPVARIYAFDRLKHTAFQVDLLLGTRLWIHVKVHNPNEAPLNAYWWTNAAVTTYPDTRVLSPAQYAATWGGMGGDLAKAPWPHYADAGKNFSFPAEARTDHSWVGSFYTARDVFLRITETSRPYVAHVDPLGAGSLLLHAHPLNGSKFWVWGMWPRDYWWQNAWGMPGQVNTYAELQVGPAPTQENYFTMDSQSTRQWTEVMAPARNLSAAELAALRGVDHAAALATVEAWRDGADPARNGVPASLFAEVDAFLAGLADTAPPAAALLHLGGSYAALEEARRATAPAAAAGNSDSDSNINNTLAPGLLFPSPLAPGSPAPIEPAARPWWELLVNGTFSAQTLAESPVSFMTHDAWAALLRASVAAHGGTWLHYLQLATHHAELGLPPRATGGVTGAGVAAEVLSEVLPALLNGQREAATSKAGHSARAEAAGNWSAAKAYLAQSLAARNTSEVQRALAVVAQAEGDATAAQAAYMRAYELAEAAVAAGVTNAAWMQSCLGAEIAQFLAFNDVAAVAGFLPRLPKGAAALQNRVRVAQAASALHAGDWEGVYAAVAEPLPQLGYDIGRLQAMWWQAKLGQAAEKQGSPLNRTQQVDLRRASPYPDSIAFDFGG